jgi:diguanylate cyclase (GGDEF)-like protein
MNINAQGVVVIIKDHQPKGIMTERDVVELLYRNADLEEKLDNLPHKKLITTRETRQLGHALNLMAEHNIRRLIITDSANIFLGVVTQHDMLKYIEEDYYRSSVKVKHILDRLNHIKSILPDDTLSEVLKRLVENKISAVPVIRDGKAIGIITEKDILKLADENVPLDSNVCSHMSSPVICSTPDTPLVDIVKVLNDLKIKRVVIVNDKGIAINMLTVRDIFRNTESDYSKFLERKLKSAKDVLNLLPEMLLEITDTGNEQLIIWANNKFTSKFGDGNIDKHITDFIPEENWSEIYSAIIKLGSIEHIKFKKDNEIFELSGYLISTDKKTEKGRFQLVLRDITEDVMLSITDSLTGIYNRRFINEFLQKEIERSRRNKRNLSIVICDIDEFKKINDTYGHPAGDNVLKTFSDILTNRLRKSDVVGRYGGDEFVIILPETTHESSELIVSRIRTDVENAEISVANNIKVKMSASFGIADFPEDGTSADDLLVKSDSNLYLQKQKNGRRSPKVGSNL